LRVGVVTFPGSNCDADAQRAIDGVDGLRAVRLWHGDADLAGVDAVVLPGGFSWGDYLRPGAIARVAPIVQELRRFADAGGPVLGICNGFQILCEAGLLPGALQPNRDGRFRCMDVWVKAEGRACAWLPPLSRPLRLPIAHAHGAWTAPEPELQACEDRGQLVLRYVTATGERADAANPNGSARDVAGVCNAAGNVLGLMPHPERAVHADLGSTDGLHLLTALLGRSA